MKTISSGLKTYFQRSNRNAAARAYLLTLTSLFGDTVRGTSWDEDIVFETNTYYSTSGGAIADIETTSALNVDNTELKANFDSITSTDLKAGLWNGATFTLTRVNPDDLTMGALEVHAGTLGQITIDRLQFIGELRGRLQSLQQSIGWIVAATCPHTLGDELCTIDLEASPSPFVVDGTADSVSSDGLIWTDAARTEAGPSGGTSITSIDRGTTTTIHTTAALGLTDGAAVNFSAMIGFVPLSGPQQAREPTGTQFKLNIDTTNTGLYTTFVSGTVTPLSAESGYFAYGKMQITSGANAGIWREVKSSIVGSWTLHNSFPFAVTGTENYTMVAGDDKLEETCRVKFSNILNFLGFRTKGNDWITQVGRQE